MERSFPIEDLLHHPYRRWVVLGEPGSGKTTQLHHLALHLLDKAPDRVPVLLKVSELLTPGWEEALRRLHAGAAPVVDRAIRQEKAVLLLDGLDEVLDKPAARKALRALAGRVGACPIFVSSRPYGFEPLSDEDDRPEHQFQELGICPLDEKAQLDLLGKWEIPAAKASKALEKVNRHSRMKKLATNPLLLSMMALLLDHDQEIPERRADLYRDAVQLLLRRETGPGGAARQLQNPEQALEILAHLALRLHDGSNDLYGRDALWRKLRDDPRRLAWVKEAWGNLDTLLREICETTMLLVPDGPDPGSAAAFAFPHRSFREYLAARALVDELSEGGIGKVSPEELKAVLAPAAPGSPKKADRRRPASAARRASAPTPAAAPPAPTISAVLQDILKKGAEDPATWTEILALACGLAPNLADALVRRLAVSGSLPLMRRVVADAEGLKADTLWAVLGLEKGGDSWGQRVEVLKQLPALTGDLRAAVELAWKFTRQTRHAADLWFAREFFWSVARGEQREFLRPEEEAEVLGNAADYATRVLDHTRERLKEAARMITWVQEPATGGRLEYMQGSPEGEKGRDDDEGPQRRVRFACGFAVMETPVTNALYECFDPEHKADRHDFSGELPVQNQDEVPAYNLTWYEAQMFSEWIATAAPGSRLPVEAEWEYFCRAGSPSAYHSGTTEADLKRAGWYGGNSGRHPHPVRQKEPNAWGLYDCHGNVWEWCLDERRPYHDGALDLDPRDLRSCPTLTRDSVGNIIVPPGTGRVFRGGSWLVNARGARSAYRDGRRPAYRVGNLGFRLVRPPQRD